MDSLVFKWSSHLPRSLFGGLVLGSSRGSFVLFVMIFSNCYAMTTVASELYPVISEEASMATLGAPWQTIWHVTLKAARSGIFSVVVFGMARHLWEALAYQMVVKLNRGTNLALPTPASPSSSLTMGEQIPSWARSNNNVLWSLALVLLLASLPCGLQKKSIEKLYAKRILRSLRPGCCMLFQVRQHEKAWKTR